MHDRAPAALPRVGHEAARLVAGRRGDDREGRLGGRPRVRRLVRRPRPRRSRPACAGGRRRPRRAATRSASRRSRDEPVRAHAAGRVEPRRRDARRGLARPSVASVAVVPLVFPGDETRGAITLVTAGRGRRLSLADLALDGGARPPRRASRSRTRACTTARSHIATTLQRSLLPPRLPDVPGPDDRGALPRRRRSRPRSAATSTTSSPPPTAGWSSIGDVTGKGPVAAAITSLARYTLRTAALYERRPERVLERLNDVAARRPRAPPAAARRSARTWHRTRTGVRVAARLRRPPAALRAARRRRREPAAAPGTLLGAFDDVAWQRRRARAARPATRSCSTPTASPTPRAAATSASARSALASVLSRLRRAGAEDVAQRIDAALLDVRGGPAARRPRAAGAPRRRRFPLRAASSFASRPTERVAFATR